MPPFQHALAPSLPSATVHRVLFAALLLFLTPLAAHAQSGQGNPNGGSNNPEQSAPVVLTVSVAPDRVPITSGTATLTWSGQNARYCSVDGVSRAASGSATVGPWTTAGAKSILVECWNNGKAGYAASTVTVTVYNVAKPVVTTTLSKSLLEAGKDTFVVTYSATNAKSCMLAGTKYPTSGSATLGPYPAGKHSLTFSCSGDGGSTSHTINWEAINAVSVSAGASPGTVKANGADTVRVSWTGSNADSCKLDGATAAKSGSKTFGPYSYSQTGTKSATVSCTNRLGSASDTATWKVEAPPPTVSASLSETTVTAGVHRVTLSWTSTYTDSCSYGGRTRATSGTVSDLGPFTAGKHSFTVSCTGKSGAASDTASLSAAEAPAVTVSVNPTSIEAGTDTSTLTWSSEHATSCSRGGTGVATSGSATVGPYDTVGTRNFTVSCSGPGGTASGTAKLAVEEPPPPPPDPPVVSTSLSPTTVTADTGTSTLSWNSTDATSCDLDGTTVRTSGSKKVGPYSKGTYRFTVSCTGAGGSDSDTARLTVVPLPSVIVSLSATTVTADTDTVDLTWSSTDATSCKYGSANLSTSGTRTVGPFSAGTHDLTVSCTGAGGTTGESVRLTARKTASEPDNDMDGIADSDDPDDDNDGMTDAWEIENDFNPLSATDATSDADNDGHDNLTEFKKGSHPRWSLSKPGNMPVAVPGFDREYTVQRGLINSDQLQDLLIRNPKEGIVPAVSDFVLIQQSNGGFVIDDANKYLKSRATAIKFTPINSVIRLHDLNADGVTDMLLHGLKSYVQDAADQIVYSNYGEMYTIPSSHIGISDSFDDFFSDLSAWIKKPNFFEENVSIDGTLPVAEVDEAELQGNHDAITGSSSTQWYGIVDFTGGFFINNSGRCVGLSPSLCYLIANNGFWGRLDPFLYQKILMSIRGTNQIVFSGPINGSTRPSSVNVYDTSRFDQHARMLALDHLRQFRNSRTLKPGSGDAVTISEMLEAVLGSEVFVGGLETAAGGAFPTIGDYSAHEDIVRKILRVFEFILHRVVLPAAQFDTDDDDDDQSLDVDLTIPEEDDSKPRVRILKSNLFPLIIDRRPKMPPAEFSAYVLNWSGSGDIKYSWRLELIHTTRNEKHTFGHAIPRLPARLARTSQSLVDTWEIDWGNILAGGFLKISVVVTLPGDSEPLIDIATYPVSALNPTRHQIQEFTGGGDLGNITRAVAWTESKHRQFDADRYTGYGLPLVSTNDDDGWGLMQLDNLGEWSNRRMEAHLWNWRDNLQLGKGYLDLMYTQAKNYLTFWYKEDLRKGREWDWNPDFDQTDTVSRNIWDDALSRYNTGDPIFSSDGNMGKENCDASRGDKIPFDKGNSIFDGCDYRNEVRKNLGSSPWLVPSLSN